MNYIKKDNTYILRLEKGEEILSAISECCIKNKIECGIINCIGAVNYVQVGNYNVSDKKYISTILEGNYEIASMGGNISTLDNKVYLHIHGVFTDEKCNARGGHVNKAIISATCEIFIQQYQTKLTRINNEEIGLNVFNI